MGISNRRRVPVDPPISEDDLRRAMTFIEQKAAHLGSLTRDDIEAIWQAALARADRDAIMGSAEECRSRLQRQPTKLVRRRPK